MAPRMRGWPGARGELAERKAEGLKAERQRRKVGKNLIIKREMMGEREA